MQISDLRETLLLPFPVSKLRDEINARDFQASPNSRLIALKKEIYVIFPVIFIFLPARLVFCYQNCSDLL